MSEADRDRWEPRWQERQSPPGEPEPYLVRQIGELRQGPLLDVACGDGRNALWLAAQGFPVTAIDIAASAVGKLTAAATAANLTVSSHVADLDQPGSLHGLGPFASLVVLRYRPTLEQWGRLLERLRPQGQLLLCSFGLDQHRHRGFPRAFCLEERALRAKLEPHLALRRWDSFVDGEDFLEGSLWQKAST